jgi:hypothetical protein
VGRQAFTVESNIVDPVRRVACYRGRPSNVCLAKHRSHSSRHALCSAPPGVAAVGIPAIRESLAFDSLRAHVGVRFSLYNGGISPALGATASPYLMIRPLQTQNIDVNIGFIRNLCINFRNIAAREKLAGILVLPRETVPFFTTSETLARDYFPEPDGSVSVWIVACVDYRDQFGTLHGIGGINSFEASDGRRTFKPEGTIDGHLKYAFFQIIY